jgi:hypothetical protein
MSKNAALRWLVENSPVNVASYAELERTFGWKKPKGWKVLQAWRRKGYLEIETVPDSNRLTVVVHPTAIPIVLEDDVPDDDETAGSLPVRETSGVPAERSQSAVPTGNEVATGTAYAHVMPRLAPIHVNRRVGIWTLIAALVMAGFSTVLTVMGFAVLLPGWLMLSMGLGTAMEFGRLVVVGTATRGWHDLNGLLRCGAVLYVVLAESVSLIGVYSELHNLHTGNRPEATAAVEQAKAETAAKVDYQKSVLADLDTQIGNVDRNNGALITADAKRGRVKDGKSLIGASDKQRAPLVEQRKQAAAQLANLQGDAARATGRGAMIDAEVSQVKQVAALLGVDPGDALRWWLLAITILIGPCASLLIAMATHGGRR